MTTIHLLYVDDEENWLNAVGQILQTGEFVVDTATDGEMALQKMAEQRYDMILLDLLHRPQKHRSTSPLHNPK